MCFRFPLKPQFNALEYFDERYDIEDDMIVWLDYNDAQEVFELHVR